MPRKALRAAVVLLLSILVISSLLILMSNPLGSPNGVRAQESSCDPQGAGNCTVPCNASDCSSPPAIAAPCQNCAPLSYASFPNFTALPTNRSGCSDNVSEPHAVLSLVATGLTHPLRLKSPPGDDRLFVVDQIGTVRIIDGNGTLLDKPFLDISDQVTKLSSSYDERGLLGLAFSPHYSQNGKFYVYYNAPLRPGGTQGWDNTVVISEFNVSSDPNVADQGSERVLMMFDKPESNHNGGDITFGLDGFLYIPTGDGGAGGDSGNGHISTTGNAQSLSSPLGKILRIDVNNRSGNRSFSIPDDNPFVGLQDALPSIYAYSFRNPISLDFDNGTLFAADAGQNCWEEANIVVRGGDYGWNLKEGTHCFDPSNMNNCNASCRRSGGYHNETFIDPIIEVKNPGTSFVIAGGVIYHGAAQGLNQSYLFAIWEQNGALYSACPGASGEMWSYRLVNVTANGTAGSQNIVNNGSIDAFILGLGQDSGNTTYLLTAKTSGPTGTTGSVWRIS